jgi:hypothetical protein
MTTNDKATTDADTGYRQAREVQEAVDRWWLALIDLDLSQKEAVIDRVVQLFLMEEGSHEPLN